MAGYNVKLLTAEREETDTNKEKKYYLLIGFRYSTLIQENFKYKKVKNLTINT